MPNQSNLNEVNKMKQLRDKLRVQINLFDKDLRDEWKSAEEKWKKLENTNKAQIIQLRRKVSQAEDVGGEIMNEIKMSYKRIKNIIDQSNH